MKKILFAAVSLEIGGIEQSLVTLIEQLSEYYKITLVLEEKKGPYLDLLENKIEILEYKPCRSKIYLYRKCINMIKKIIFKIKHKNKYDYSAAYATYSLPASFIARTASKNSSLWVHSEYFSAFNFDEKKYKEFYEKINIDKFNKIIFISENAEKIFKDIFKDNRQLINKTIVIHNFIKYKEIELKAQEKISDLKKEEIFTFLNVGRHTEFDKQLSYLIKAAILLKKDNLKFRVIMIGDGKDHELYKKMVKENSLESEIMFLGTKKNPYPYFKISDCFILTSRYEGYPVVFHECFALNLPIITTNVSDSEKDVNGKFGIVVGNSIEEIYNAMKCAIKNGISTNEKFNYEEYNKLIKEKLERII